MENLEPLVRLDTLNLSNNLIAKIENICKSASFIDNKLNIKLLVVYVSELQNCALGTCNIIFITFNFLKQYILYKTFNGTCLELYGPCVLETLKKKQLHPGFNVFSIYPFVVSSLYPQPPQTTVCWGI